MGRVKSHYHNQIANQATQHIPIYPEEPMTEAEQEAYFDHLYEEYKAKEEAYKFEDNYEPFETAKPRGAVAAKPKGGA